MSADGAFQLAYMLTLLHRDILLKKDKVWDVKRFPKLLRAALVVKVRRPGARVCLASCAAAWRPQGT